MKRFVYQAYCKAGGDRAAWALDRHRLRILSYHGVCDDRLAHEPWMPRYFVSHSAFESQLKYLERHATVLPLSESVARLSAGSLPPRAVSLTFDDGYANNLHLAYPLLRKYEMTAAIFVSSAYVESGELFPFLKLRLIQLQAPRLQARMHVLPPADYKSNPMDLVSETIEPWWAEAKDNLTPDQHRTLRPLTGEEIAAAGPSVEFGSHTHTHCILNNETDRRRRHEISSSVAKVTEWSGRPVKLFSYPNGERGDFGEPDKQALRAAGVEAAVTGIAGSNRGGSDLLELKRYPIGIGHGIAAFGAEVTGFRSALQSIAGKLAS